jgi:pyruvate kinase
MSTVRPTLASIVATLGPASDSPEMLVKLIDAGVSVFRLNFSHGSESEHQQRVEMIRATADLAGLPIAILGDLPGPKIRVGACAPEGVMLEPGQDVLIDPGASTCASGKTPVLSCLLESIGRDVLAGQKVLINDGAIRLLALERAPGDPERALRARVVVGGLVTKGKGINLPQSDLHVSAISDRDWAWARWAVKNELDFLALSFVRSADEVRKLKAEVGTMPVVSKIETPQAVARMDEIIAASDAIMVARGDLGVEMEVFSVPVVQKKLVRAAAAQGKPCIVATQMLESMVTSSVPTRAEASDVANAIFDGADAVMLSAETAVGKHPALVVDTMRRIIASAEAEMTPRLLMKPSPPSQVISTGYRTAALAHGAWYVARDVDAKLIVCWSQTGGLARYLSQMGLAAPVIAFSSSLSETRRMALLRGVTALCQAPPADGKLSTWNERVDEEIVRRGWAKPGDAVVLIAGRPMGQSKPANTLAVHYVGQRETGFSPH